jgi:hypothetical protein
MRPAAVLRLAQSNLSGDATSHRLGARSSYGNQEDRRMPETHDYLTLESEAGDLAEWTPDPELAAHYNRLAASYQSLGRFHERLSALVNAEGEDRDR